jgi:uncharacterized protein DUF6894
MRYFFDLFIDGNRVPDSEGRELTTVEDVQREAIQLALELKREFPRDGAAAVGNIVEVTREDGRRVFALPIHRHQCGLETVP